REDEEQRQRVGIPEIHDSESREGGRKPQEEPVVAEVQRDPHADRHDRAAQQVAPEQRGHGGSRDRRLRGELGARHLRAGHGPQDEQAWDVEREGRQGREDGIAQDARLEQEPSAARVREAAQRQAADQGPHERGRRDGAVGEGISRSEGPEIEDPELGPDDGEDQADEDDFEGHEGPREPRDEDDASMKRGEAPTTEDVLDRARRASHEAPSAGRYMRVRGTASPGERGAFHAAGNSRETAWLGSRRGYSFT